MQRHFLKMNGAGNDFVVFDARKEKLSLNSDQVRALSSRENEVTQGCDQLIIIEKSWRADAFMRIYNADGGEVDACGNATRCVGDLLLREDHPDNLVTIRTNADTLKCRMTDDEFYIRRFGDAVVSAEMGVPTFNWKKIPLSSEFDDAALEKIAQELGIWDVQGAACVGMGNPHVVFFVETLPVTDKLCEMGEKIRDKKIEMFAKHGVNLTIAQLGSSGETIFSKVYERGAGLTKSCGTAACATAVAAVQLGYRRKNTNIEIQQLQNGTATLFIRWEASTDRVFLIGPVEEEFEGVVEL